jgi:hypothetical protein
VLFHFLRQFKAMGGNFMSSVSGMTQPTTLTTTQQQQQASEQQKAKKEDPGKAAAMKAQLDAINQQIQALGGSPVAAGKGALQQAQQVLMQLQQQKNADGQNQTTQQNLLQGLQPQGAATSLSAIQPTTSVGAQLNLKA